MPGTRQGGLRAKVTLLKRNPNHFMDIGSLGGRVKSPLKGFGSNRKLASTAGRIGGLKSKRGAKLKLAYDPVKRELLGKPISDTLLVTQDVDPYPERDNSEAIFKFHQEPVKRHWWNRAS